jgi:CDP-diglyceride synthetase
MLNRTRLTTIAVAIGGIALAVGGVLQILHPHEGDQAVVDDASEYVTLATLVVALLGIAPGFQALARYARDRRGAIAASAGTVLLALTCVTSLVNGEDLSVFAVIAPLTNAAWFFGSIALAVSLKRAGRVPRAIYVGLPLAWVATIPLSTLGGGLVAGAFWMAVAYMVASEEEREDTSPVTA